MQKEDLHAKRLQIKTRYNKHHETKKKTRRDTAAYQELNERFNKCLKKYFGHT